MKLKPLGDRVIVERKEQDVEKSTGGIIIPDTAKEKPQSGIVVAVGEGKKDDKGKRIPMDVAVGEKIIFGKYSGDELKIDGKEYLFMNEDDIMAKKCK